MFPQTNAEKARHFRQGEKIFKRQGDKANEEICRNEAERFEAAHAREVIARGGRA